MTNTLFRPSIYRVDTFQPLAQNRPALTTEWTNVAAWYVDPQYEDAQWWFAACVDVGVDLGVVGEVRWLTSANEGSWPARFWTYIERTIIGWGWMSDFNPRYIWLQARVGAGTTNTGGGVHVMRATGMMMSAPPTAQQYTVIYPPGYDPQGDVNSRVYPPSYSTATPYG